MLAPPVDPVLAVLLRALIADPGNLYLLPALADYCERAELVAEGRAVRLTGPLVAEVLLALRDAGDASEQ